MACRVSTHSDGDSDSDWDDDDDFANKRITIKIKPIAQITPNKISASVDELRATVGTWKSLANINLVKPNSRRHHQSNVQLESTKFPVAFAIQECLNAKLYKTNNTPTEIINNNGISINGSANGFNNKKSTTNQVSLIGRLKMAVPPKLASMDLSPLEQFLEFELVTSIPWDYIRLNEEFIRECDDGSITPINNNNNNNNNHNHQTKPLNAQQFLMNQHKQHFASSSSSSSISSSNQHPNKRFLINMESVQSYVKQQYQKQPNNQYFLVPELLRYVIGSQHHQDNFNNYNNNININNSSSIDYNHQLSTSSSSSIVTDASARVSPLNVLAHWLCDLTITKVRIDVQFLENTIDNLNLITDDIKNLKISLVVNGGVVSYQSKPEANWDSVNTKLTWSFASLTELTQLSTSNGLASCLARLDLNDGPSTPSDVNVEFSISEKTLTGTHVILNGTNFCIAKQKYEVRTGTFKCRE